MEIRHHLQEQLKRLKMPGLWQALDLRLAEARDQKLGHLEFLSLLIQDELANREDNMLGKRLRAAGFGVQRTFEDFDFRFNEEALPASMLRDLATCHFIAQRQNLVIGGPPGIGKTHAVKAIGHEACRRGYQVLFRTTQKLLAEVLSDSQERAQRILRRAVAVDLLILDLSRPRDYPDARECFSWVWLVRRVPTTSHAAESRDNHRASRKASSRSGARNRPTLNDGGVVRASARSLTVMSACK